MRKSKVVKELAFEFSPYHMVFDIVGYYGKNRIMLDYVVFDSENYLDKNNEIIDIQDFMEECQNYFSGVVRDIEENPNGIENFVLEEMS